MSKALKIVLGVLTFVPLVASILFFGFAIVQMFTFFFSQEPTMPMLMFSYMAHALSYIEYFILFYLLIGIFYLIHILQNRDLDTEKRLLWTVVLISFNGLAMPVYWYVHIWKSDKAALNY